MKKLFKIKIIMLLLLTLVAFACKKENNIESPQNNGTDSIDMTVDTVGPAMDSCVTIDPNQNGKNGTTGATGEGTTGSSTAGSTQKGNQNVRTDSIKK